MYSSTSYTAVPSVAVARHAPVWTTVEPDQHIAAKTGRCTDLPGVTAPAFWPGDTTDHLSSLVFRATGSDTPTGSFIVTVPGLPPHLSIFQLDFTVLRPSGTQTSLTVTVDVLENVAGGTPKIVSFTGTLDLPASHPLPVSRRVQWSSTTGPPEFRYNDDAVDPVLPDLQPFRVTLTTTANPPRPVHAARAPAARQPATCSSPPCAWSSSRSDPARPDR